MTALYSTGRVAPSSNGWLMTEIRRVVGNNISSLMQAAEISKAKLARIVGKSQTTIKNWLIGENLPEAESLEILANHFGLDGVYVLFKPDTKDKVEKGVIKPTPPEPTLDQAIERIAKERGFSLRRIKQ